MKLIITATHFYSMKKSIITYGIYFTSAKDRLMWGAGRILHHENLYGLVQRLKELDQMAIPGSLDVEIRRLEAAIRRQQAYLKDDLHYMKQSVDKIQALINDCLETSSHYNKEKNGENQ